MADNGQTTYLSYPEAKAHVEEIESCKEAMRGIFNDFGDQMKIAGGEDVFYGDASESFQSRYNSLKQRFDSYCDLVQQFANNVNGASEQTAYTERELAARSEELKG